MTSKERVRAVMAHQKPDRIPAAFEAVHSVQERLMKHYGFTSNDQLMEKFDIDIIPAAPKYIGPELKSYINEKGQRVQQTYWGYEQTEQKTDLDTYWSTTYFPLNDVETVEDVNRAQFPDPDWFDYTPITEACEKYADKAIIIGHPGPFQMVTFLIEMDRFFMLMIDEPEAAQRILDRMVEFELEYYKRCFEAGKGKVDILRPHDDYGTQISMLFSVDMWREFFKENTKKLVDLAHQYGAFYQQHSCGAVGPIIPDLIECGVDALEPLQKVVTLEKKLVDLAHQYGAFYQQHSCGAVGPIIPDLIECGVDALEPLQKVVTLEPEVLAEKFEGKITFHGGIDTQGILPYGTADEVRAEVKKYMEILGKNGGYILMASQAFEGDVPIENIEAVYSVER